MPKGWAALSRRGRWLAVGLATAAVLAITWVLFVPVADWLVHHDVGAATGSLHETALDNARGRLLTLGAGLVAAVALVFTALNFNLLRRNSEQTDQWQRRTYELTEQGQVTDRYTRAIEQLGSDKLDVRIGGIYALERIAGDSARDHPTVTEVLSAFVREHSREQWSPPVRDGQEPKRETRPDVQAALTVLGRRDVKRDAGPMNLSGADLSGATLNGAMLLCTLLSPADLSRASLSDANLNTALLLGSNLSRAYLSGASLIGTILIETDLSGADLSSTNLQHAFLLSADLTGADLTRADLSKADLRNAILAGADLTGADLADAQFDNANFADAKWPKDSPVPGGWKLDGRSGRLQRAGN